MSRVDSSETVGKPERDSVETSGGMILVKIEIFFFKKPYIRFDFFEKKIDFSGSFVFRQFPKLLLEIILYNIKLI